MNKLPITKAGLEKLEAEYKELKTVERPKVIDAIAEAREHGDLKENAEYHAAREKQGFVEGRIQDLENVISKAEVIDVLKHSGGNIIFGATVLLIDDETEEEKTYQIVSEYEANIEEGRISNSSPIARSLMGKEEGDIVKVKTPGGIKTYEVLDVKFV